MNEQQEALRLALEALEDAVLDYSMGKSAVIRHAEAIAAIKEALAQDALQALHDENKSLGLYEQEQEPWLLETTQTLAKHMAREFYPEVTQWECLDNLAGVISQIDNMTTGLMRKSEQKPVAWLDGPHLVMRSDWRDRANYKGPWVDLGRAIPDSWVPALYTTPPQRTAAEGEDTRRAWVGIDDEEIRQTDHRMVEGAYHHSFKQGARWAEAKLKEKNTWLK